jgi:hypothetical protein
MGMEGSLMPWEKLIHKCETPNRQQVEELHADIGSLWTCDSQGCMRLWKLTQISQPAAAGLFFGPLVTWTEQFDHEPSNIDI